jgi:hypothetical protein
VEKKALAKFFNGGRNKAIGEGFLSKRRSIYLLTRGDLCFHPNLFRENL